MKWTTLAKNLLRDLDGKRRSLISNKYQSLGISWATLKQLRAASPDKNNQVSFKGSSFHYTSSDELLHALDEIFLQELYRSDISCSAPYIIDCGAHIGVSVVYFKLAFPNAELVAFEPDENNFSLLSKNVASYGFKNVDLVKKAVWNENGVISFANEGSMSSRIDATTGNTHQVPAARLKAFLHKKVDFLKMDIEGAEYAVLKDIAPDLSVVERIFIEYHGSFSQHQELLEILQILTGNQFRFYIKEANPSYPTPFYRQGAVPPYDVQLNIFAFRQ